LIHPDHRTASAQNIASKNSTAVLLVQRAVLEVACAMVHVAPSTQSNERTTIRPLRIAQLVPPVESVPPRGYGGLERVVAALTDELVDRGHQVTLFASADSRTNAEVIPVIDQAVWHHPSYHEAMPFVTLALDLVYRRADEFDLIHNHLDFHAFPFAESHPETPTLTTLHGRLDLPEYQPLYRRFASQPVISISDAQRAPLPWISWVATIHNGIVLDDFVYQPQHDGYLAFLGRIAPEKGLDTAIRVAQRAGLPIRIAARMPLDQPYHAESQRDWHYYHEVIRPLLRLPGVEYIGEVGGAEKSALLGGAAAMLFPIVWPEPFGLVMAESLACGTPVVALRRGSVPEVLDDGITGFLADDEDGLVRAIARLDVLDRARCRRSAETRFSSLVMADRYEDVYLQLLGETDYGDQRPSELAIDSPEPAGPVT
jgi:glycosyltransferase involved in cell wall biosynthesis